MRGERARERRVPSCAVVAALVGLSAAARAQPLEDAQQQCLAAHEQAQLDRIDIRLRAAVAQLRVCSDAACPSVIRGDCIRWIDEVTSAIPTVIFAARSEDGDESDVTVLVNGEPLVERLDGRPVELDPGPYLFRFVHPLAPPVERQVILREGEKNRVIAVDFDLRPEAPATTPAPVPPPPPLARVEDYRPVPVATYLFAGLALAGVSGSLAFGLSARSDRDAAERDCAPLCGDDDLDPIRTKAILSDVSSVVAIGSIGAATLFFLHRPTRQRAVLAGWNLSVGRAGGLVTWEGSLP